MYDQHVKDWQALPDYIYPEGAPCGHPNWDKPGTAERIKREGQEQELAGVGFGGFRYKVLVARINRENSL